MRQKSAGVRWWLSPRSSQKRGFAFKWRAPRTRWGTHQLDSGTVPALRVTGGATVKKCPNCRVSHWDGVKNCDCGYSFDTREILGKSQQSPRGKWIAISLLALGVLLWLTMISPEMREKRREIAAENIIPHVLEGRYPPAGECINISTGKEGTYLYHQNGVRKASKNRPDGLDCTSIAESDGALEAGKTKEGSLTTEFIESELQISADIANKNLPSMVDESMRWDSAVAGPGRKFTFLYTLLSWESTSFSEEDLHAQAGDRIRDGVCGNEDMQIWLRHGVAIVYEVRGKDGGVIGDIMIEEPNCSI